MFYVRLTRSSAGDEIVSRKSCSWGKKNDMTVKVIDWLDLCQAEFSHRVIASSLQILWVWGRKYTQPTTACRIVINCRLKFTIGIYIMVGE